jgi:hypothetical protein
VYDAVSAHPNNFANALRAYREGTEEKFKELFPELPEFPDELSKFLLSDLIKPLADLNDLDPYVSSLGTAGVRSGPRHPLGAQLRPEGSRHRRRQPIYHRGYGDAGQSGYPDPAVPSFTDLPGYGDAGQSGYGAPARDGFGDAGQDGYPAPVQDGYPGPVEVDYGYLNYLQPPSA